VVLVLVLLSIAMGVTGQFLLKVGASTPVHSFGDLVANLLRPSTVAALALYGGATCLWITALSRAPLSYVYPLLGLNFVIVVIVSAILLHEQVSMYRWLGVGLVAIGFIVVATS